MEGEMVQVLFCSKSIILPGACDFSQGVATDPNKIKVVAEWSTPASLKELRSFLGLVGYYRCFVLHFGIIAKPLTTLLKKGVLFI
jgi:transposase InsO family protein